MKVSNPLTIIALFAGLAEAFATVALINLPESVQNIFVYFVMGFPLALVLLFFYTLHKNHKVLYGPGDFQDQKMFLDMLKNSISEEFDKTLLSESTVEFTDQQKNKIKGAVSGALQIVENRTRKEQILSALTDEGLTVQHLVEALRINETYARRLLNELFEEGKVLKRSSGNKLYWRSADEEA